MLADEFMFAFIRPKSAFFQMFIQYPMWFGISSKGDFYVYLATVDFFSPH